MLNEYVEKLHCAEESERIYAAEDIGYLNTAAGVPPLLQRLEAEPSRAVRDAIFQALIRIDDDASIKASIRLLGSDDPQIRNQAVDVLRHKGAAALPFLDTLMQSGNKNQRKLVLDVLSELPSSGAEAIYELALADEDPNVVITAVENLGRTHATPFRRHVEDLLWTGGHPMLLGVCLEALAGIGDARSLAAIRGRLPDLAAMPDFLLVPCLKAFGALGEAGEFAEVAALLAVSAPHLRPAILGSLVAIHQRFPRQVHETDLLPALQSIAGDGDSPLCRYEAVRALGILGSRDDVYSFLVSSLASPERMVRLGAVESLRAAQRPGLESLLASHALDETDEEVLQALRC